LYKPSARPVASRWQLHSTRVPSTFAANSASPSLNSPVQIATTGSDREDGEDEKAVIVSTGGSSLKDIDDLVTFFDNRHIPLAINHCVSLYPSEDCDIELNQIDFLRNRYPITPSDFPRTNTATGLRPCSWLMPKARDLRAPRRHSN